jgi:hypothetical protein
VRWLGAIRVPVLFDAGRRLTHSGCAALLDIFSMVRMLNY